MLPRPVVSIENLNRGREAGGLAGSDRGRLLRGTFYHPTQWWGKAGQGLAAGGGGFLPIIGLLPPVGQ